MLRHAACIEFVEITLFRFQAIMVRRWNYFLRRRSFRLVRILIMIFALSIVGSVLVFLIMYNFYTTIGIDDKLLDENIPDHCVCTDNDTSITYNFCYHIPSEFGIPNNGTRFSCEWLPTVKKLGLLDLHLDDYFRFDHRSLPSEPPFVCAASESHFETALTYITSVHTYFKSSNQRIVFYDLGLSKTSIDRLRRLCNVEHRRFPFDRYPKWVRSLSEYRWKPILIAEALKDFGVIWYMDSSVQLEKGDLSHVYALLNCRTRSDYKELFTPGPTLVDENFIESGFHTDLWTESIKRCDKFAYMLQGFTGHGIFSATNPGVYTYIPTDVERIKKRTSKMYEAGHVFMARTVEVIRDVLKWYVLCALEKDCMAPPGSSLGCSFSTDRFGEYAQCHRYDQSVVNLLLANRNHFDSYYWTSGIVDYFHIVRYGGLVLQNPNSALRECGPNVIKNLSVIYS